jgi:D-glycerate 3-kinase
MEAYDIIAGLTRERGVLFLGGSQGSGKSTIGRRLAEAGTASVLSLDDFYLTRAERERLAAKVSPLALTRGPPGTHDTARLTDAVHGLKEGREILAPSFDKRKDERRGEMQRLSPRPVIVVEGWLLGVLADPESLSSAPLNEAEKGEEGYVWRQYQEDQLLGPYKALFNLADHFAYLLPQDFQHVTAWRRQQEEALLGLPPGTLPPAEKTRIGRFVGHFERLTRRMMNGGRREGTALLLDGERRVVACEAG